MPSINKKEQNVPVKGEETSLELRNNCVLINHYSSGVLLPDGDFPVTLQQQILHHLSHSLIYYTFNHKLPLQSEDRRQIFWLIVTASLLPTLSSVSIYDDFSSCHSSNLYNPTDRRPALKSKTMR